MTDLCPDNSGLVLVWYKVLNWDAAEVAGNRMVRLQTALNSPTLPKVEATASEGKDRACRL